MSWNNIVPAQFLLDDDPICPRCKQPIYAGQTYTMTAGAKTHGMCIPTVVGSTTNEEE